MKIKYLALTFAFMLLSGCGNYKLISYKSEGLWLTGTLQWKQEQERLPQNGIEKLVAKVADDHQTLTDGNKTIMYVSGTRNDSLVAVIENLSDHEIDTFTTKKVDRYIIKSGYITASMGPNFEPFPDAEFERSVISAAKSAEISGGSSIIVFMGWSHSITLKGVIRGRCYADIAAYKTEKGGPGPEICRKKINYCRPDYKHLSTIEPYVVPL